MPKATEYRIGIRDLKSRLSECVREVKAGYTVVVTEHGRPVARLVPEPTSMAERLHALTGSKAVRWSGRALGTRTPVARARRSRTVADLVSENRE